MIGAHLGTKGPLRPDAPGLTLERAALDERFDAVARQVWLPRWSLPGNSSIDQPVLQYPGLNVVVEPEVASVYLPIEGVGVRTLTGDSWAAGLLMRPGAGVLVVPGDLSTRLGEVLEIPDGGSLARRLRRDVPGGSIDDARAAFEEWLEPILERVDDDVRLVNAIADAAEQDASVTKVSDLVERFGVAERRLQRLIRTSVGFSPRWLIQRRRLQEAAHRLREDSEARLADLAADLGYSDQAHFTRDFRTVIGQTPGAYRVAQAVSRSAP